MTDQNTQTGNTETGKDEAAPPPSPNSNTNDRGQGTEKTDGNGRNFTGQGAQKEGSSKTAEGTGYKE